MLLSTSLPHTSQPSAASLQNISKRGKSGYHCAIKSLILVGFLLCFDLFSLKTELIRNGCGGGTKLTLRTN